MVTTRKTTIRIRRNMLERYEVGSRTKLLDDQLIHGAPHFAFLDPRLAPAAQN